MKEPTRSIEDPSLPESFRNALGAHAVDRPNAERMARMAKNLEQALGMPLAAATLTPGVPSLAWSVLKVWPWLGLGAAVISVAAWWANAPHPHPPSVRSAAAPQSMPPMAAAPAPPKPQAAVALPAPPAVVETPVVVAPERRAARSPRDPGRDRRPTEPSASLAAQPAPAPSAAGDPAAELALLQRAQQQLTAAPALALALATQHQARYPDGVFRQERELIAIVALLRRGQLAEARARSERFRSVFPGSVYLSRLESLMHGDNPRSVLAPMIGKEDTSW